MIKRGAYQMGTFLKNPPDFNRHNEDVNSVWSAYNEGKPARAPLTPVENIEAMYLVVKKYGFY